MHIPMTAGYLVRNRQPQPTQQPSSFAEKVLKPLAVQLADSPEKKRWQRCCFAYLFRKQYILDMA